MTRLYGNTSLTARASKCLPISHCCHSVAHHTRHSFEISGQTCVCQSLGTISEHCVRRELAGSICERMVRTTVRAICSSRIFFWSETIFCEMVVRASTLHQEQPLLAHTAFGPLFLPLSVHTASGPEKWEVRRVGGARKVRGPTFRAFSPNFTLFCSLSLGSSRGNVVSVQGLWTSQNCAFGFLCCHFA